MSNPLLRLRAKRVLACAPAILALAGGFALAQSSDEKPVTIYLVRHAEKQDPASNPDSETPLAAEGQARAAKLAELMSGCRVSVAYTTPYKRTIDTAKPLVERNKIAGSPVQVPPREIASLPERIRQSGATTVLVVGHSNTVPANARALAGKPDAVPNIADDAYHDLFVVTVTRWEPREATVRHFRFGNAPPTASALPEFTGCK
jgi:broad specificity phosphatase PhoE